MRKSWLYMGSTALILGVTILVAWFLAVIAIPVLIIGGILAVIIGTILPEAARGFYFCYDSKQKKLVKKKI